MRRTSLVALVLTLALAACAPQPTRVTTPSYDEPENFPAPWYREAAARGQPVFRVDPGSSLVVVEVYRTGPLARLGHDHVVASHDVQGYLDPAAGRADLYLPLDALTVDEPALRAAAHLDTQPTDADIAGTRRNMLGPVLDASHFPFAQLSLQGVGTRPGEVTIDAMLTLHGVTRRIEFPIDFGWTPTRSTSPVRLPSGRRSSASCRSRCSAARCRSATRSGCASISMPGVQ